MPTPKELRAAAAKQAAETRKAQKLHVIAERRAKAAKMSKADYIAAIVKGKYAPITQEDIETSASIPSACRFSRISRASTSADGVYTCAHPSITGMSACGGQR